MIQWVLGHQTDLQVIHLQNLRSGNFQCRKLLHGNLRRVDFLPGNSCLETIQVETRGFQRFDGTRNKDRYLHNDQVVCRYYIRHHEGNRMRDDQALHN